MRGKEMEMLFKVIGVFIVCLMCGCGGGDPCEGVDTSQAPDSSSVSGNNITYYWGSCSRTYQFK